jgi:DnaJ domain
MTAATKLTIFARIEAQQFVGYVLWGVWRRTRSKQYWADSIKIYGRTDTIEQAWGMIAALVNDLPLECLRSSGMFWSWRDARTVMRQPGEGRFQEGTTDWLKNSSERKQELYEAGVRFLQIYSMHNIEQTRLRSLRQALSGERIRTLPRQCLKVLGLDSDVQDLAEIKQAYRNLASLHHPDKGGDSKRFVAVRQAYEQLTKSF